MDDTPTANLLAEENARLKAVLAQRETQLVQREQLPALLAQRDQQLAQREAQLAERDRLLTQHQATIAAITQQRDDYYLEKLRLEVRLAKALKQVYGPRADRVDHPAQLLLDFAQQLEALPIRPEELPPEDAGTPAEASTRNRSVSRRLRTRGRRDIGSLNHLPFISSSGMTGSPAKLKSRFSLGLCNVLAASWASITTSTSSRPSCWRACVLAAQAWPSAQSWGLPSRSKHQAGFGEPWMIWQSGDTTLANTSAGSPASARNRRRISARKVSCL